MESCRNLEGRTHDILYLTPYTSHITLSFASCMLIQSNQLIPHNHLAACPMPADEAMRHAGLSWQKERLLVIYTQLLSINDQHIHDLDAAAVSPDVGGIFLCRTTECTACIAESKLLCYLGVPWCNGGFPIDSPEFITWLHLLMLIDIFIPPCQSPASWLTCYLQRR